jgi:hypothetical protein
MEEDLETKPLL